MRKCTMMLCCLVLTFLLVPSTAMAAKAHIKLAHGAPPQNDRLEHASQAFKKYVEEKTNGEISVQTYPNSQLGGERENMEGIILGTIEAAGISTGPFPAIFAEVMVFDIPFVFTAPEIAYAVADGPFGDMFRELMLKKTGIRCLGIGEGGYRHFTNNIRPVKTPDDLKGLKIRTMENAAHMQMMRELGAIPTPIPFPELYTALAQKVVDGEENPLALIESMRYYEVQKYVTLDGHFYGPHFIVINEAFYQGLSKEHQKIIDEAGRIWKDEERKYNQMQSKRALDFIKSKGTQVTALSPDEIKAFSNKATQPVADYVRKQAGNEIVDAFFKAVKEAEEALEKSKAPLSPVM